MDLKENWFVTICPKCKSTQVMATEINPKNSRIGRYACLSCGYEGPIFPEIRLVDLKKLPNLIVSLKHSIDGMNYRKNLRKSTFKEKIILLIGCSLAVFIFLLLLTNG